MDDNNELLRGKRCRKRDQAWWRVSEGEMRFVDRAAMESFVPSFEVGYDGKLVTDRARRGRCKQLSSGYDGNSVC